MPISYQFHNDHGPVPLAQVDDWLCEQMKIPPSPVQYCPAFHIYIDSLTRILIAFGGSEITCRHILQLTKNNTANMDDPLFYELIETFDFTAWR